MSVYFRYLLVLPWLLPLLATRILTGSMTLQQNSTSEGRYSLFNGERQEAQSILNGTVTPALFSEFAESEPSSEPTPRRQEAFLGIENVEKLCLKSAGKALRLLFLSKRLFFLHVLFFAGLMVAFSKTLDARKAGIRPNVAKDTDMQEEEEGQVEEEEPASLQASEAAVEEQVAKTKARIEKIRGLLPAAYRLASATDSEASWKLLEAVHMAVKEVDKVTDGEKDCSMVKVSLLNALTALNGLHRAAFQQAEELVETAKSVSSFPLQSQWNKGFLGLLAHLEEETELKVMAVLLKTYNSFEESAATLAQQQCHEGERIICSSQQFKDENDTNLLLRTAKALEYLHETAKSRSRLNAVANRLSDTIFFGFKEILLQKCNEFVQETESLLEVVELYAAMWKPKLTYNISEEALSLLAKNTESQFDQLQEKTSKAHDLLKELFSLRRSMLESTTLAGVCAAYSKARDIEKKAFILIQKCLLLAAFLPSRREDLETRDILLLAKNGEEAVRCLTMDTANLSEAMKELRYAAAELSQGVDEGATSFFSKALIEEQLRLMDKIATNVEGRVNASQNLLDALKNTTSVRSAMAQIFALRTHRRFQERSKRASIFLHLSMGFFELLKEDTENAASEVFYVARRVSSREMPKYKGLEEQFNAAKMNFQKATTLQEAANAAADMRNHAYVMREHFLFSHEKHSPS